MPYRVVEITLSAAIFSLLPPSAPPLAGGQCSIQRHAADALAMQGVHARVIRRTFFFIWWYTPCRSVTHGQAVVGQRFHSCWGHRLAVGQRHTLSKTAPHSVGQRGIQRYNVLFLHMVGGRGYHAPVRRRRSTAQSRCSSCPAARPGTTPPGKSRHQIDHRRILLVAAGADDAPSGLLSMM